MTLEKAQEPLRSDYPTLVTREAIAALELSYSYLRDKPIVEEKLSQALHLLYLVRESREGIPRPGRTPKAGERS